MALTVNVRSGSTVANTVLDLSHANYFPTVSIINRSTAASPVDLWVRMDGTVPTVAGDNCYLVPANSTRRFTNHQPPSEPAIGYSSSTTNVQVISSTICAYSVEFS